ncbi:MAG: thiamine phosphate synthase [Actinomycetota bacterium]|nr:thiamine phosphate synthase [Actinomycetota bacterium]
MALQMDARDLYLCINIRKDTPSIVAKALDGGVNVVQIREKEREARDILKLAEELLPLCHRYSVPLFINDRADLVLLSGVDGIHVGQGDIPVEDCRRLLGSEVLVGLSTHSTSDLIGALQERTNYISAGPVDPTPTKPQREGTGIEYVEDAVLRSSQPVFVTGGVDPDKVLILGEVGVRHFVVVRYIADSDDPFAAASRLRVAIDSL